MKKKRVIKIGSAPSGPDHFTRAQAREAVRKVMGKPRPKQLNRIQILNPKTGRYVKINTETGGIMAHKKSPGPFKDVQVVLLSGK